MNPLNRRPETLSWRVRAYLIITKVEDHAGIRLTQAECAKEDQKLRAHHAQQDPVVMQGSMPDLVGDHRADGIYSFRTNLVITACVGGGDRMLLTCTAN